MSPQDLSFISSSSEESLLEASLVMEGVVDANISSAGPVEAVEAVAAPHQSSDEDNETIHEDLSSIEKARALLENAHSKQILDPGITPYKSMTNSLATAKVCRANGATIVW